MSKTYKTIDTEEAVVVRKNFLSFIGKVKNKKDNIVYI